MTIDKIIHYIGKAQTDFICSLNKEQLKKMLFEAEQDLRILNTEIYYSFRFERTVEIRLIKNLLGVA